MGVRGSVEGQVERSAHSAAAALVSVSDGDESSGGSPPRSTASEARTVPAGNSQAHNNSDVFSAATVPPPTNSADHAGAPPPVCAPGSRSGEERVGVSMPGAGDTAGGDGHNTASSASGTGTGAAGGGGGSNILYRSESGAGGTSTGQLGGRGRSTHSTPHTPLKERQGTSPKRTPVGDRISHFESACNLGHTCSNLFTGSSPPSPIRRRGQETHRHTTGGRAREWAGQGRQAAGGLVGQPTAKSSTGEQVGPYANKAVASPLTGATVQHGGGEEEEPSGLYFVSDKVEKDADGEIAGGPIYCCQNALKTSHECMFAFCYGCLSKHQKEQKSDKDSQHTRTSSRRTAGKRRKVNSTAASTLPEECDHKDTGSFVEFSNDKDYHPTYLNRKRKLKESWPPVKCQGPCNRKFVSKLARKDKPQ